VAGQALTTVEGAGYQELHLLRQLVEHLRSEAVSAYEALAAVEPDHGWSEHAQWLRLLTEFDLVAEAAVCCVESSEQPVGVCQNAALGLPAVGARGCWSPARALTWLAEHRALVRVLTTPEGNAEVLVSVRPPSDPEQVLMVRRPLWEAGPLPAIVAALEEASIALESHESRPRLRLVTPCREQNPG
jgi:hypothetical protein